jgi:hypothetical protein
MLRGAPHVLHARKPELPEQEIERQLDSWTNWIPKASPVVEVDSSKPIGETAAHSYAAVVDALERRALRNLGAGWVGFPRPTAPRWILPRKRSPIAESTFNLYQPVTRKAVVGWNFARGIASIGAFRLAPRSHELPRELLVSLAPHIPPKATVSVMRANHAGRFVALIVDRDGNGSAVAKFATHADGREQLMREADAIRDLGPCLPRPLSHSEVLAESAGLLLLRPVIWRVRRKPWTLPSEVAHALGVFYRQRGGGNMSGPSHGDCAPWNLLKVGDGWTLVDWESATADGAPFADVFHYMVQSSALLNRPSRAEVVEAIAGKGSLGVAVRAYAAGAQLELPSAREHFITYLKTTPPNANPLSHDAARVSDTRHELMRFAERLPI